MNKVNERGAWCRQIWFARRLSLSPVLCPFQAKFSPQIIPALHSIGQRGTHHLPRSGSMIYFVPCEGSLRKELAVHIHTSPIHCPSPLFNNSQPAWRAEDLTDSSFFLVTNRAYTHWVECDIFVLFLHHSISPPSLCPVQSFKGSHICVLYLNLLVAHSALCLGNTLLLV